MKKNTFTKAIILVAAFVLQVFAVGLSFAGDSTVDIIVLSQGESRSIDFEYDSTFPDAGSYHVAVVTATSYDGEIHQLKADIVPIGDTGAEIAYFSWGIFYNYTAGGLNLFEVLEPKYTYGYKHVTHIIDVKPDLSIGLIFSAAMVEYSHFDFPLSMAMTLTMSN